MQQEEGLVEMPLGKVYDEDMDVTSKKEGKSPSKIRKVFAGTILSFLVGGPIAGGVIGYKVGESLERRNNKHALERAAGYGRCIEVVRRNAQPGSDTAVVHLVQLSEQERADCQIFIASEPTKDEVKSIKYYLPLDASLIEQKIDTTLQLPTPSALNAAIRKAEGDAADFNRLIPTGSVVAGTFLGLVGGVILSTCAIEIDTRIQRNRDQGAAPSSDSVSISA